MKNLEKLKVNGFPEIEKGKLHYFVGGYAQENTNESTSRTVCDNQTGIEKTYTTTTVDNPDGTKCTTTTVTTNS